MRKKGIWLKIVKIQENNLGLEIVAVAMKSKILKRTAGGAATDIRASAATSEAQAATGASLAKGTEAVSKAAKEIIVQTAVSRVWTDRTLTSPSPRRASPG